MKARWLGMALAVAAVAAGCGEGRAILNVDVFSFLQGTAQDTVPYLIPPGGSNVTASNVPERFRLPGGLSCSVVDTVRMTGAANLVNSSGSATLSFQIFIAGDSLGTFNAAARAVNVGPVTVSGTNTTPVTLAADLSNAFNTLFTETELWIRMAVQGSNPGLVPAQGKGVLTALDLRVIVQDKIC